MHGSYDYALVVLSVLISILAASAALALAGRVSAAQGTARLAWLLGGATASGIGTWSMHYTGMLAFKLPVPVEYHWPTALLSLIPAVCGFALALFLMTRWKRGLLRVVAGGVLVGGGISGMHYIAMASMRLPAKCHYSPSLVALSVLLAILFSVIPLRLTLRFQDGKGGQRLAKAVSVLLLGAANPVMHYTGMAAATFTRSLVFPDLSHCVSVWLLSIEGVTVIPLMVLAVALVTSLVDRLRKHSALLDELFEHAPQAVVLTGADGRVQRVNSEFTRVFGYPAPEAAGRQLDHLIVPEEWREEFQKQTELVLTPGQRVDADGVGRRKDGSRLQVSLVRVPVAFPGGQTAIYSILRDITLRKRTEERLRVSEAMFRALAETVPAAIFVYQGTELRYANPALELITGYGHDELLKTHFWDFIHPDFRELVRERGLARERGDAVPTRYEFKILTKAGEERWLDFADGKFELEGNLAIVAMAVDITERKRTEEALRESEERFRAIFQNAAIGIALVDAQGHPVEINAALQKLLGYSQVELANKVFTEYTHPEDVQADWDLYTELVEGKRERYQMEKRFFRKDGQVVWGRLNVSLVRSPKGEVKHTIAMVEDITEGKRAEEELQRSRDQLRALAARVQQVREEESTKLAREIHDELGQALTAIRIELSSLIRRLPADKIEQSRAIVKLVDETIHSVRRISAELRPAILDIGIVAAVEWAAEEFEARTGIKCHLDLPQDDVVIAQERATELFRIFQETLTNVARHANAAEVKVRLAQAGGNLTLEVQDNGKGVSEENLSTGSLGILGMRERALLLGGRLTISGARGEGTTVRVRIPVIHPTTLKENK